jgi:HSP20 family protein
MSNKILIGVVAAFAVALLVQTGYLIGKGNAERRYEDKIDGMPKISDRGTPPVKQPNAGQDPLRTHSRAADHREAWDPLEEMSRMQRVMNRMFSDSFGRASRIDSHMFGGLSTSFDPAIDVEEQDEAYIVVVDLPGVDKDTINISAQPNSLTISGERSIEKEQHDDTSGVYRAERSFGSFQRTIPLMARIVPNQVTAETSEGVLVIKLPKEEITEEQNDPGTTIKVQ